MITRIREIRTARGMTLAELAKAVGTTPQTIQRLETDRLTVSLEWLNRIAEALNLQPSDLLPARVRYIGELQEDGVVVPPVENDPPPMIAIDVPGNDPMAVKLIERLGPYEKGTILVVDRIENDNHDHADGRDCLISTAQGQLLFRRVVANNNGPVAFVPYDNAQRVERQIAVKWVAPVMLAVRYFV